MWATTDLSAPQPGSLGTSLSSQQNHRILEGKGFVAAICFRRNRGEHGTHRSLMNKHNDEGCWWSPRKALWMPAGRPGSSSHSVRIQRGLPSSSSAFGGTPREEEEEISPTWSLCSNMTMNGNFTPRGSAQTRLHPQGSPQGRKNPLGTQTQFSKSLFSLGHQAITVTCNLAQGPKLRG